MKRLLSLLFVALSCFGSLNAMHGGALPARPGFASFMPGPALMFKKLYLNCVPSKGELALVGGFSSFARYLEQGTKNHGVKYFLDNSYLQSSLFLLQCYAASQPLAQEAKKTGQQEATSLEEGFSRFASVLTQNIVYKYGICKLVSLFPLCAQANALIEKGCKYHWVAMIGISLAEHLALITAENVCKQVLLKPVVDGVIRKLTGLSTAERIRNGEPVDLRSLFNE